MSQETAVKVLIADREYPLKLNEGEVEGVRAAELEIQQKLKNLKANYQVKEKQDLLAMCLLQLVVEKNQKSSVDTDASGFETKIKDLESFVSDYLKSIS